MENESDFVWVESVVTDQGNGGSWCSGCETPIGIDLEDLHRRLDWVIGALEAQRKGETVPEMPERRRCPGCGKILRWGGVYIPAGGSDF